MIAHITLFFLVVAQNASFTLVSRARNSKSILYHALAAVCSNGVWLLVFHDMVVKVNTLSFALDYLAASVIGSIGMHWVQMRWIEKPKAKPVQKPMIGRIVYFYEFGQTVRAAIITRVINETTIDLTVFGSSTPNRTSVTQGNDNYKWNWPEIK